jgi:hypothetical protein
MTRRSITIRFSSTSTTQAITSTSTTTEDSSKDKNDYNDKIFYDVDSIIFYFDIIFYHFIRELQPRLL